jgi:hypothetical protein
MPKFNIGDKVVIREGPRRGQFGQVIDRWRRPGVVETETFNLLLPDGATEVFGESKLSLAQKRSPREAWGPR